MKIKNRFRIVVVFFLSIAIVFGSSIFLTTQDMNETMEKDRIAEEIVKDVFELNIVSYDYSMYHEERPKTQWLSKYDSLGKLLTQASEEFKDSEEQAIVKDIRQNHESLDLIFSQLVSSHEKQNLTEEENATLLELEKRLTTQLMVKSLSMVSLANQLSEESHAEVVTAQERVYSFTVVSIVLMGTIIVASSFWVGRGVLNP